MNDLITTSLVLWTYGSLTWRIQNFSDVSGLKSGYNENESGNIGDHVERVSSKEFASLLDIDFLQSPMIHVGSDAQQTSWFIRLVKSPKVSNEIDVYIDCDDITPDREGAPEDECYFKYTIEIKGSATSESVLTKASSIILIKKENSWCEPGFLKLDFLRNHMTDVLEDDTLTLKIELAILRDVHHSNNDGPTTHKFNYSSFPVMNRKEGDINLNSSERKWAEDVTLYGGNLASCILSSLGSNRNCNGDVTIQCAESTFTAHKTILSGASPVFLAAFTHDMTERASGQLKIDDVSPEALEALLNFIYGDYYSLNVEQPKWKDVNFLAEVLNAAEKYQIVQLKMLCFSKLCDELSLNNAAKIVVLVHLYEPEDSVRKFIHEFAIDNISVLRGMKSFREKINEIPAAFTPLLLLTKTE